MYSVYSVALPLNMPGMCRPACWTHEAHRFENLVASRLDCCGRCEIEEDTENTELGRHVDAYTRCEGGGGLSTDDGSQVLQ